RGAVVGDIEPGFAIGKVKRPRPLRYRVPRAWLEKTRRAGVILTRARPQHAEFLFNPFIGDASLIGDSTRARASELVKDFAGFVERETMRAIHRRGDILNDLPISAGVAG